MKIICLNTWGNNVCIEDLAAFFNAHKDVDIFCLQEIIKGGKDKSFIMDGEEVAVKGYELFDRISESLPEHTGFFRPHFMNYFGLAIFVKKGIEVLDEGERLVHKGLVPEVAGTHARNIQYVKVVNNGRALRVINFHGLWNGQGKADSEDRIKQSAKILGFTSKIEGDYVLCGDFNLLPDTQSIKVIEDSGLRNLITEYGVTSTRTSLYKKSIKFADYAFVTEGIEVKDFKVLPHEVSDHAPLYLEIR
jgi:endonuclease/exonuclease/phosphatase family metal-dependent hydrolase